METQHHVTTRIVTLSTSVNTETRITDINSILSSCDILLLKTVVLILNLCGLLNNM